MRYPFEESSRGTGRTTKQMEALPVDGVFISCAHAAMHYDAQLARKLNRPDIKIVSPSWVTSKRWAGQRFSGVVLDHYYFDMNKRDPIFIEYLSQLESRVIQRSRNDVTR